MISIYAPDAVDFSTLGLGALAPYECTVECDGMAAARGCEADGRQAGIFAHYVGDEFGDGDGVYFGAYMPETEEEVKALLEEYCDTACLESVEF